MTEIFPRKPVSFNSLSTIHVGIARLASFAHMNHSHNVLLWDGVNLNPKFTT